jgi:hypothetical protein
MFQTKDVKKKHFYVQSLFFLLKSYRLCNNMKKCRKAGQATCDNMIRRMRFACYIASVQTHAHNTVCNAYRFTAATVGHERTTVLRYTYMACRV